MKRRNTNTCVLCEGYLHSSDPKINLGSENVEILRPWGASTLESMPRCHVDCLHRVGMIRNNNRRLDVCEGLPSEVVRIADSVPTSACAMETCDRVWRSIVTTHTVEATGPHASVDALESRIRLYVVIHRRPPPPRTDTWWNRLREFCTMDNRKADVKP